MFKSAIPFIFLIIFVSACNSGNYQKPDDPIEAGTDFIRFALDGDMTKAKTFVLPNEDNESLFREHEKSFAEKSKQEKDEYKNASIRITKTESLNDSTMLIIYSNSYKNKENELKLVRVEGEWWVDFKYTFTGDDALESLPDQ
ncbi:MAG: DUF4878 domain-containing protein [Chitinophagaceae bacterium]|nr:DUF4878 domain-containing protein [Chitinophagaceae bacterium]MCW5926225.1 DUF4878 domain-containing protein [Chitinophagaceae bacterium]